MFRWIAGQKEYLGATPSVAASGSSNLNSLKLLPHQLAKHAATGAAKEKTLKAFVGAMHHIRIL